MDFDFLKKVSWKSFVSEEDIFDIVAGLFDGRMGLHELADLHSEKLDEIILKDVSSNKEYMGGKFHIALINDAYMELSYEMYFKNDSGEYVKKEAKSKPVRTSYLNDDAIKVINEQLHKKISFDINPPNGD